MNTKSSPEEDLELHGPLNPISLSWARYHKEKNPNFQLMCDIHASTGVLVSTPWFFMAVRPVRSDAPEKMIRDPTVPFRDPDMWYIYEYAGDMLLCIRLLEVFPLNLRKVAWARNDQMHGPYFLARAIRTFLKHG